MGRLELINNIGRFQGDVYMNSATDSIVPPHSASAAMKMYSDDDGIHYYQHPFLFDRSLLESWEGTPHMHEPMRMATIQNPAWTLIILGIWHQEL